MCVWQIRQGRKRGGRQEGRSGSCSTLAWECELGAETRERERKREEEEEGKRGGRTCTTREEAARKKCEAERGTETNKMLQAGWQHSTTTTPPQGGKERAARAGRAGCTGCTGRRTARHNDGRGRGKASPVRTIGGAGVEPGSPEKRPQREQKDGRTNKK